MGLILLILFIAVPIAELWVIVQVADGIGVLWTLLLLFSVSIAGAWLLKQQGLATWRRVRETMARGDIPTKEMSDGALILLGGALLLTPGFITDAVGLVLLLPPTRTALKGGFRRFLARRARRWEAARGIYTTRVVNVERTPAEQKDTPDGGARASSRVDPLPSGERRSAEDGSRDTR